MENEKVKWDVIAPEIKNDMFYGTIIDIARLPDIKTILEIGASSGEGSTEALMVGKQGKDTKLFSLEVCTERFGPLKQRYKDDANFFPYNYSSVGLDKFPPKKEILNYMRYYPLSRLSQWKPEIVMDWYDKDIEYVEKNKIPQNGIAKIKEEHGIKTFDCVLIDGSEFLGKAEMEEVYGAKYILLDDILSYKNWANHKRLLHDPSYMLLLENNILRNGFSVFINISNM